MHEIRDGLVKELTFIDELFRLFAELHSEMKKNKSPKNTTTFWKIWKNFGHTGWRRSFLKQKVCRIRTIQEGEKSYLETAIKIHEENAGLLKYIKVKLYCLKNFKFALELRSLVNIKNFVVMIVKPGDKHVLNDDDIEYFESAGVNAMYTIKSANTMSKEKKLSH